MIYYPSEMDVQSVKSPVACSYPSIHHWLLLQVRDWSSAWICRLYHKVLLGFCSDDWAVCLVLAHDWDLADVVIICGAAWGILTVNESQESDWTLFNIGCVWFQFTTPRLYLGGTQIYQQSVHLAAILGRPSRWLLLHFCHIPEMNWQDGIKMDR